MPNYACNQYFKISDNKKKVHNSVKGDSSPLLYVTKFLINFCYMIFMALIIRYLSESQFLIIKFG